MTTRTMYEVYDRRTEQPVTRKHDGSPVQLNYMSAAAMFVKAFADDRDDLHFSVVDRHNIPACAELDVRPVSVEVGR